MEMQELEIVIDQEGSVQITVKGAKGDACLDTTQQLEEAIGEVEERTFSAEYYEPRVTIKERQKTSRD
jgi:hypothetical protein